MSLPDLEASDYSRVGLTVKESNLHTLSYSFSPVFRGWDTIQTANGEVLRPDIAGARLHQSADGSNVQWVVSFDVVVPHENGFAFHPAHAEMDLVQGMLEVGRTPTGVAIPTEPVLGEPISMTYTGIARGRHIATVFIVVASSDGQHTRLITPHKGTIRFAPANLTPTQNHQDIGGLSYAINPEAPWRVSASRTLAKGEMVQGGEALTNVFQMDIREQGVYRLSSDDLKSVGIPTDASTAKSLKIFGRGGRELSEVVEPATNDQLAEQAIIVSTNTDGSIKEVVFYASGPSGWSFVNGKVGHYIHHYDTRSGYLLTYGGSDGRRSQMRSAAPSTAIHIPLSVTGYQFQEEELSSPYNSGSGRKWFGRGIENNGSLTITTQLPGLLRTGNVFYRMNVAHKGSQSGSVTMYENGEPIAQRFLPSVPDYMDTYSASTSGSMNAANLSADGRSVLRFSYECSDNSSSGLIDWFEIHYPRGLIAHEGQFEFFADSSLEGVFEYTVNGFDGGAIYGFDISDKTNPIQVENTAPSGGLFGVRESREDGGARQYFLSSSTKSVSLARIPDLTLRNRAVRGELGDYLVITNPSLLASATRYADYRRSIGELNVTVVTTDEIFREFSYTVQDPTSIRDFIAYAYRHAPSKPRYVLFWGDGHFDYKRISTATPNYVIPYESLDPDDQSYGLSTYTTDDYFVRIEGNDKRPEMPIGRLPITSNAIGDRMTSKIRNYETSASTDDWRTRVCLVADDGQVSNGESDQALHLNQSERLAGEYVPREFQPKKIYLVEYPTDNVARGRRKPSVTADIVSTINTNGSLILNWIGHGNPRVWAHEFVFERETTPAQFNNSDKPFFLTAATCDFARFDLTDVQSGAEELVLKENGGAIGVFSAARVVFAYANAEINQEFYTKLFTPEPDGKAPRMGDVLYRVKQRFFSNNDEKFFLLGDPTLRLLIPDHHVVFETVNGVDVKETVVTVEALSTVTVTGFITKPTEEDNDNTFNGVATISLLDAQRDVTVVDNDRFNTVNNFSLPGAALMRGSFEVDNGRFTATFVVPKDISFSSAAARLYGYAVSDDERTAKGSTNNVIVDGVASHNFQDLDGPEIDIYLDSRKFLSGNVVRENPILIVDLEDKTGINTTGIGVGHGIEALFTDVDRVEDLTETFSTSLENSRAGTASKQVFNLGAGHHSVRVRAWDVLNNMAEKTTTFRIATTDEGTVASWVSSYPNPFHGATTIQFRHNNSGPFTATIRIYDTQGRMVFEAPMTISDMQTATVTWDASDNLGNQLGSGIYLAVVEMQNSQGGFTQVAGKLALIR